MLKRTKSKDRSRHIGARQVPRNLTLLFVAVSLRVNVYLFAAFGFLGFYICRPDLRGKGLGLALWNAALERKPARTIGLDGVTANDADLAIYRQLLQNTLLNTNVDSLVNLVDQQENPRSKKSNTISPRGMV